MSKSDWRGSPEAGSTKLSFALPIAGPVYLQILSTSCFAPFTVSMMPADARPGALDWDSPSPNARFACTAEPFALATGPRAV